MPESTTTAFGWFLIGCMGIMTVVVLIEAAVARWRRHKGGK